MPAPRANPGTIAVIGAGPVGLAAAAQALERGFRPLVLEAGPQAGHAVRQWGHVRLFSAWQHNIDGACGRLLDAAGWVRPEPSAVAGRGHASNRPCIAQRAQGGIDGACGASGGCGAARRRATAGRRRVRRLTPSLR